MKVPQSLNVIRKVTFSELRKALGPRLLNRTNQFQSRIDVPILLPIPGSFIDNPPSNNPHSDGISHSPYNLTQEINRCLKKIRINSHFFF